jgi:hypothetical protein
MPAAEQVAEPELQSLQGPERLPVPGQVQRGLLPEQQPEVQQQVPVPERLEQPRQVPLPERQQFPVQVPQHLLREPLLEPWQKRSEPEQNRMILFSCS